MPSTYLNSRLWMDLTELRTPGFGEMSTTVASETLTFPDSMEKCLSAFSGTSRVTMTGLGMPQPSFGTQYAFLYMVNLLSGNPFESVEKVGVSLRARYTLS